MALALLWTSILACFVSLCLGLYGLFFPKRALKLVGLALDPERPEGISEVRATYGGFFAGVSLMALLTLVLYDNPFIAVGLGAGWLMAGFARVASVLFDRATFKANIGGIVAEFLIAAFLIMPPLMVFRPIAA